MARATVQDVLNAAVNGDDLVVQRIAYKLHLDWSGDPGTILLRIRNYFYDERLEGDDITKVDLGNLPQLPWLHPTQLANPQQNQAVVAQLQQMNQQIQQLQSTQTQQAQARQQARQQRQQTAAQQAAPAQQQAPAQPAAPAQQQAPAQPAAPAQQRGFLASIGHAITNPISAIRGN